MSRATVGSKEVPEVLVAILNYNRDDLAAETIRNLQKQAGIHFDLEVVDNASDPQSLERLIETCPEATIVRLGANLGYAGGSNAILRRASEHGYDFVVICNNDVELAQGTIANLVEAAQLNPDAAIVGTVEKDSFGRVRPCVGTGYNLWLSRTNWQVPVSPETRPVMCVQGATVLYRVAATNAGVTLDEELFTYYEEPDLGFQLMKLGWKALFVGDSFLVHKNDDRAMGTRAGFYLQRNRVILVAKHGNLVQLLFHIGYVALVELPIKTCLRTLQGNWAYSAACWRGFAAGVSAALARRARLKS